MSEPASPAAQTPEPQGLEPSEFGNGHSAPQEVSLSPQSDDKPIVVVSDSPVSPAVEQGEHRTPTPPPATTEPPVPEPTAEPEPEPEPEPASEPMIEETKIVDSTQHATLSSEPVEAAVKEASGVVEQDELDPVTANESNETATAMEQSPVKETVVTDARTDVLAESHDATPQRPAHTTQARKGPAPPTQLRKAQAKTPPASKTSALTAKSAPPKPAPTRTTAPPKRTPAPPAAPRPASRATASATRPTVPRTTPKNMPTSAGSRTSSVSRTSTAGTPGANKVIEANKTRDLPVTPKLSKKYENVKGRINASSDHKPGGGNVKIPTAKLTFNASSKINSLQNAKHTPGGGQVKIESRKLNFKENAKPKVDAVAEIKPHVEKKIATTKLEWKAESKVGSMQNINHKAGGGDVKIFNKPLKLDSTSKVGSLENATHKAGGGNVKITEYKVQTKTSPGTSVASVSTANSRRSSANASRQGNQMPGCKDPISTEQALGIH